MNNTSNYRKYTSENPVQRFLINNFKKTLFLCLDNLNIKSVLDAGCGEGFVLSEFDNRNIGNHLEGLEYSEDAINTGGKMFPHLYLRQGDIYNMPYEDSSFDLIICTEVMEHLEKPEKALDEIVRVSKAYCLLSVPNEPLFMIANLLRGKNISRWGNDIDHVNHWNSEAFENFISKKINVITVKKPFPWTVVLGEKEG